MADAATAHLRIAQAAQSPVTVEQIVEALRDDEDATSLSVEQVVEGLGQWRDAGVVEELPGERWVLLPVFGDDLTRRVVSLLARPRNVESLRAEGRSDPQVGSLAAEFLDPLLEDLVGRGLVVKLGEPEDAEALVAAVQADADAISMPDERADGLVERLGDPSRAWQLEGEQFVMTTLAHDALRVT